MIASPGVTGVMVTLLPLTDAVATAALEVRAWRAASEVAAAERVRGPALGAKLMVAGAPSVAEGVTVTPSGVVSGRVGVMVTGSN